MSGRCFYLQKRYRDYFVFREGTGGGDAFVSTGRGIDIADAERRGHAE